MTIEDARAGGSPAGVGAWCGVVLTSLLFAGVAVGALVLRPRRIELVHTETRGSATGRLFRVGRWTEAQGWIGRSRYVLEIIGGDNRVHKIQPLIFELDPALELLSDELDKLEQAPRARAGA